MLLQYARDNRFLNPTFFVDDGYSGTSFDRPGFQKMLSEMEAGHVSVCISKDLSRLGRNSSLVGLYTSMTFPKYGVRYIAITDNFDSADPNSINNDFAGIKNWFNEFYARDTSRKIRAVQKDKGNRGIPLTTNIPYGYVKDPEDKTRWLVEDEAAKVVRYIFALCMEGRGPTQIAKALREEKILTPTAYKNRLGRKSPNKEPADPYHWDKNTVISILERREYTGCTVNFKTYTNSIWDKKKRDNAPENQAIFYNTHPAIVDEDVFEKVQEIRQQRHRITKTGKSSLFSGLVYCADCNAKMRYCTTRYFEKRQDHFVCANYRSNTGNCSAHFIRAVVLEDLVWMHMKQVISYVTCHEGYFRSAMEQKLRLSSEETIRTSKKELAKADKRVEELDRLFMKIYEDNASGKLSDERFSMMSHKYEEEQVELKAKVQHLQKEIEVQEHQNDNLEKFIQRVHKYADLQEVTAYALHELVKAIYIGAPDKSSGKRRQEIFIHYDLVGFIPLDELQNAEMA
jgi:DNA invertase Pin-like site-specific DNA recombinase